MRIAPIVVGVVVVAGGCSERVTSPTPGQSPQAAPLTVVFSVTGTVFDTISRPIASARVSIESGPSRGVAVMSDEQGRFTFESVAGPFGARASKAGYRDQLIGISGPQGARWFRLQSTRESLSMSGTFTMTFTADASCSAIPGYARRRAYDAGSVLETETMYLITLAGGGYGLSGSGYYSNVLYGGVFEDIAQINLSDPPIWEKFPQGSYLVVVGQAQGSIRELPTTLQLDGWFTYCAQMTPGPEPRCAVSEVTCRSSNHRLTIAAR